MAKVRSMTTARNTTARNTETRNKRKKLIINHKEYIMPPIDIDAYMDYLDVRDAIMNTEKASGLYTRKQFEDMMNCIVELYGNQFTVDELKDKESGLTVGGIITEFLLIETEIGAEVDRKVEKIKENFTVGK